MCINQLRNKKSWPPGNGVPSRKFKGNELHMFTSVGSDCHQRQHGPVLKVHKEQRQVAEVCTVPCPPAKKNRRGRSRVITLTRDRKKQKGKPTEKQSIEREPAASPEIALAGRTGGWVGWFGSIPPWLSFMTYNMSHIHLQLSNITW